MNYSRLHREERPTMIKVEHKYFFHNYQGKRVYLADKSPLYWAGSEQPKIFYKLVKLLQEETNLLVILDENMQEVPATYDYLKAYLDLSNDKLFRKVLSNLVKSGILYRGQTKDRVEYYMNPKYAFCGEKVSWFLLYMFDEDKIPETMYTEHVLTKAMEFNKNG